ncbi:GIY-YIG nuclease family protein [Pleionea sediminis]|uniref:GIY-YIG nuclease family protein n=1 Tax=Pleionea sediminis TaxID=2569479 RepID=UPI001185D529|nr:GIY-YIG nuclease family protein [Pleionea sediminis]
MQSWFVYIIRCDDDSLYTGVTTDVTRRFKQHQTKKGAKYFFSRSPCSVVYQEEVADRSLALKREITIKRLSKKEKEILVANQNSLDAF